MSPSLKLQGQFGAVEPRDGLRHSLPGNLPEDRVMRLLELQNVNLVEGIGIDGHGCTLGKDIQK